MKVVAFSAEGTPGLGLLVEDGSSLHPLDLPAAEAADGILALLDRQLDGRPFPACLPAIPLNGVTLRAPVPRPRRNIFCIGKNYVDHAHEFAGSGFDSGAATGAIPTAPIVFSKVPECVIASGEAILADPEVTGALDYEAELAVIIGRGGRAIDPGAALDHVWGYTIVNDVTAGDLQRTHKQWLIGKSLDTFCPMGPIAVTRDEIELPDTRVRAWVNGELRQDATVSQLIFDIPTLIATISAGITLYPGDIIATGTPAGVGIGFDPPRYLAPGDTVTIEIDGVGRLENPIADRREQEPA